MYDLKFLPSSDLHKKNKNILLYTVGATNYRNYCLSCSLLPLLSKSICLVTHYLA